MRQFESGLPKNVHLCGNDFSLVGGFRIRRDALL
jgi:hypothetical protein